MLNSNFMKNTGVILETKQPQDLVFGANERVKHTLTIEDRKWLPYYSTGELQFAVDDTMSCVIFSAIKVLSAYFNYLIRNKMLSISNMKWIQDEGYLNEKGEFDASERFTSAMSNTSERGNTGGRVWWSIRNHGIVPQGKCPWNGEPAAWFRNKANITQKMKDAGLESVKRFDIMYERVTTTPEELSKAIQHSPIQVFIPTDCPYGKENIQQYCNGTITHAVSKCEGLDRGYHPLFDHYIKQPQEEGLERFIRRVVNSYKFYPTGYICNVAEKLDIDGDGIVEMEDRNGRLRRFPSYFVKTIKYLLFKRGFKLKGDMLPTKQTLKRALYRALWAGITGALSAFVFLPVNFEEPKKYITVLCIGMLAGFVMGVQKFVKGWIKYDVQKN